MQTDKAIRAVGGDGGFGILSVLIAIVLMGVGIAAVSSTSVYLLSLQTEAAVRSASTGIAVSYMEEVKTRPTNSLAAESVIDINDLGQAAPGGGFTRELKVSTGPVTNSKLVEVEVTYPTGLGRRGTVSLVTIIYEGT